MPSKAVHLETAEKNANFAKGLDASQDINRGWGSTALFYSALHLIEAYFTTLTPALHSADHRTRDSNIGKVPVTKAIYDEYQELKNLSQAARYRGEYPSLREFNQDILGNYAVVETELKAKC